MDTCSDLPKVKAKISVDKRDFIDFLQHRAHIESICDHLGDALERLRMILGAS